MTRQETSQGRVQQDPEAIEWDVAVIGTGMGGAVAGHELARLGRRVIFLEKGRSISGAAAREDLGLEAEASTPGSADQNASWDSPEARLADGLWPERIQVDTSFGTAEFFAPLGCGLGGSTALYAAALERLAPADFRPRANFPDATASTLPEAWPVTYDEMVPYYERAEEMFRVRGTQDTLYPGEQSRLWPPPPLGSRDEHLQDSLTKCGLHPYRAHVGCAFVDGCAGCAGVICQRGCKSDAGTICIVPAVRDHGARLLLNCEAVRLDASRTAVLRVRAKKGGEEIAIRARAIVVSAGAYMSPVLLLNSTTADWPAGLGNRAGLVGRNLMFHASDYFAIAPLKRLSVGGPQKGLALNDFYHSAGEKLGTFQSAGVSVSVGQLMQYMRDSAEREPHWWMKLASPHPAWWRKLSSPAVRFCALLMHRGLSFNHAAIWASVIEDLPYYDNRVIADPRARNGMRVEYRYPEELRRRVLLFRTRLATKIRPHRLIRLSGDNNLNYGHACGTCRFGHDARSSVLDHENRVHGLSNLYVVDASFFPSSGGTNPSLTIAANALRAAGAIHAALQ